MWIPVSTEPFRQIEEICLRIGPGLRAHTRSTARVCYGSLSVSPGTMAPMTWLASDTAATGRSNLLSSHGMPAAQGQIAERETGVRRAAVDRIQV